MNDRTRRLLFIASAMALGGFVGFGAPPTGNAATAAGVGTAGTAAPAGTGILSSTQTLASPTVSPSRSPSPSMPVTWWRGFDDPVLSTLVETALQANADVRIAEAQHAIAVARGGAATMNRGPSVDASMGAELGRETPREFRGMARDTFSGRLQLQQEIDFWGKLQDRDRAAALRAAATQWDVAEAKRETAAAVVRAYWQLAWQNANLPLLQASEEDAAQIEALALARSQEGALAPDALNAARAERQSLRERLAASEAKRIAAIATLQRLQGRPGCVNRTDTAAPTARDRRFTGGQSAVHGDRCNRGDDIAPIHAKVVAATGAPRLPDRLAEVPADLSVSALRLRPDLQAQGVAVRAFALDIDAERKSLYPSFKLTADVNTASKALIGLVSQPFATLMGSLALPFLEWHKRRYRIAAAEAQYREAEAAYVKTWQRAMQEVVTTLAERARDTRQRESARVALTAQSTIEQASEARYAGGLTDSEPWRRQRIVRRDAEMHWLASRHAQAISAMEAVRSVAGGT